MQLTISTHNVCIALVFPDALRRVTSLSIKRGLNPDLMSKALRSLSETGTVPQELLPHPLHGEYEGCMECHPQPDWLLVWEKHDEELHIIMVTTGSHSDIIGKKRR